MPIVDGHIRCSTCRELKPLSEYQPSIVRRGCGSCRPCKYQQKMAWAARNRAKANASRNRHRKENRERHRQTMREHYRANKAKYRGYNLKKYGITPEEYDRQLAAQGGRCACCGRLSNRNGKRLFVDHCHDTGAVRGILCHKCNAGIGSLGDNIAGLHRAADYLRRADWLRLRAPSVRINLIRGAI